MSTADPSMRVRILLLVAVAAAAFLGLVGALVAWRIPTPLRIAAGSTGSATLEYGTELVELLARDVDGVEPRAIETVGGVRNAEMVSDGEAELALVPNNAPGGPELRTLAVLEEEVLHVVVRGAGPDDPAVLRGKRVALGPEHSGTERLALKLLAHFRIEEQELSIVHLPHTEAAEAFVAGEVDAVFCLTGLLAPAIDRMLSSPDARLLSLGPPGDPGSMLAGLRLAMPFVSAAVIPTRVYGDQPPAAVSSVGVPLLLVANDRVADDLAYEITRAVYENKVRLIERGGGHSRLWEPPSDAELRFPLHAGARQYHHRDEPPRFLDWADTISLALTVIVLVYSSLAAFRTQRQLRRKERVDKFYARLQQVSDAVERAKTEAELADLQRVLHEIRRQAFSDLMAERLQADESFTIFQDYLRTELADVEAKLREPREPREPAA